MEKPISIEAFNRVLAEMDIDDISRTSIRQCSMVGSKLEAIQGEPFSHLEIGVPGIPACTIGVEAQKKAIEIGRAHV